jgi:hypothetical protein
MFLIPLKPETDSTPHLVPLPQQVVVVEVSLSRLPQAAVLVAAVVAVILRAVS